MKRAVFSLVLAATLASSASAQTFTKPLTIGSTGSDVSTLQQTLKIKGFFTYPEITGYFGSFTYKAVADFQKSLGFEAVGSVGPLTRAALNTFISSSTNPPTTPTAPTTPSAPQPPTPLVPFTPTFNPGPGYTPGYGGGGAAASDTTAPTISSISIASTTSTSLIITWTTDEAATSQVNYGTTNGYGLDSALNSNFTTSHSVTLSDLTAGTTYHYRIRSADAAGNVGMSGDMTIKTNVWTGLSQSMSMAVQGFAGGSNWSETTRSRHYSNASFCRFRIVLQTFNPTGVPVVDTNFANDYDFAVGFEYPYVNANSGIPARIPVTFSGATSTSYTTGGGPYGYILSDVIDPGFCIPAQAFFGLWTTIEVAAHTGTNLIPYTRNASNFLEKYVGVSQTTSSQIAASTALTASSIAHVSSSQNGVSSYFTPAMMVIENDGSIPTVASVGDSITYGVGEGVAGSGSNGDPMGSALGNAGIISRGLYENAGANEVNLGRGSDRLQYLATASNWTYRKQLMALANPSHVIQANIHNDLGGNSTFASNWVGTTVFSKYTVITAGGNDYMAIVGGTTGSSAPTGTSLSIADGSVVWAYIQARPSNSSNRTSSMIFALLANVNDQIKTALPGVPIIQMLGTPDAASTDIYTTAVNQTASSHWGDANSSRGLLNNLIRLKNPLLNITSVIDPNTYLEDSYPTETSKWVSNGSENYVTYDGTHPNSTGAMLAAPSITSSLFH